MAARTVPAEVTALFWRAAWPSIVSSMPSGAEEAVVSMNLTPVLPMRALDAMGHPIIDSGVCRRGEIGALVKMLGMPADGCKVYQFFIDKEPQANWAHACAHAFVMPPSWYYVCHGQWPPSDIRDFALVPFV
jgi:hypothetical protein